MLILNMLSVFISLLFFFLSINISHATSDFTINENIDYLVNTSGQASVTHQIDIINNYSQIYPKEYQIKIQGLPLSDLSATDSQGNILVDFTSENESTLIKLKFNHPAVGKGQSTSFKLLYRVSDLAKNKGKTWEILLPQLTDTAINNSQISLKTPSSFGSLSFASVPAKFEDGLTQNTLSLQNNQHAKILIILGNYQLFNFNLNYYLKNSQNTNAFSEIAIIPDTYSQSVYYQSISPSPQSIRVDDDGNWLAKYELSPGQEIDIKATGQVKTGLRQTSQINDPKLYLRDQTFWPSSDSQIQEIASTLSNARSIYDYVINTLTYNYDRLNNSGRLGAIAALIDPNNALCTEFTDLFVTLARAKGIPAREIEGFAYSNNPKIKPVSLQNDVLHAWPEYYDTKTNSWKAIDPTWAKTTNGIDYFNDLDLNHITFVVHGLDSQNPLPPGSYKSDPSIKSIEIDFANDEIKRETIFPEIIFKNHKLFLQNFTPNSQRNLHLTSPTLSLDVYIDTILPYSTKEIEYDKSSFLKSLSSQYAKVSFILENEEGGSTSKIVNYPPHFINLGIIIISSLLILAISGIIITSQIHEKNS